MLGHKTSFSKFKNIEIISNTFSDHNGMKPEISHKKKTEKHATTWKLNNNPGKLTPILLILFQNIQEEEKLPKAFHEASIFPNSKTRLRHYKEIKL